VRLYLPFVMLLNRYHAPPFVALSSVTVSSYAR
jgi:hypothetical protein